MKEGFLDKAERLHERRVALCRQTPECPKCREQHQIQLFDWITTPAVWRCRICGYTWEHET